MRSSEISFLYARVALDLFGLAFRDDRSLSENGDLVGKREHDMHVMFDDHLGDSASGNPFQKIDRVVGIGAGHARGRFIEKQQLRILREAHGQLEPALVTT